MATQAQIAANRENSKQSTGPRTPTGRNAAAANATKFGLYSEYNCVHERQEKEFEALREDLLTQLHPSGRLEELLAADLIRAAWRVRRCADAEEALAQSNQVDLDRAAKLRGGEPDQIEDNLVYPRTARYQQSIDRARAQALSIRRRALLDLQNLQNERFLRDQLADAGLLDQQADLAQYGIASVKQVADLFRRLKTQPGASRSLQNEPNPLPPPAPAESANRTQSAMPSQFDALTARNAPCPCNSGLKYKRCCGLNAPPVLGPQPVGPQNGAVAA